MVLNTEVVALVSTETSITTKNHYLYHLFSGNLFQTTDISIFKTSVQLQLKLCSGWVILVPPTGSWEGSYNLQQPLTTASQDHSTKDLSQRRVLSTRRIVRSPLARGSLKLQTAYLLNYKQSIHENKILLLRGKKVSYLQAEAPIQRSARNSRPSKYSPNFQSLRTVEKSEQ